MTNPVALKYGKALFAVTQDKGNSDQVLRELQVLVEAVTQTDIFEFLSSSLVPLEARLKILDQAVKSKISEQTYNLVVAVLERGRLGQLDSILKAFEEAMDSLQGALRGKVTSATSLSAAERARVEEQISKATGKKVILNFEIDPNLVGGMVAQVGGWTIDDSLQSHLTRMGEELNRSAQTWN
jgi:F-type H+-transporting ATPase subunit delta